MRDDFDLTIEAVPLRDLADFADRAVLDVVRYEVLPIDPIRAAAQAQNPVADEGDAGLMVAYSDGKCIGHQGLIPIAMSVDGEMRKVIASVALFVHADFRGKRTAEGLTVAEAIYRRSLDLGFDVVNTGFGRARERLHDRRTEWFVKLPPLKFCQVRLSVLQPTSAVLRKVARRYENGMTKFAYQLSTGFVDGFMAPLLSAALKSNGIGLIGFKIVATSQVTDFKSTESLKQSKITFPRSVDTINWMINNTWHPIGYNPYPRCYFCNPREQFQYHTYHIVDHKGNLAGYLVLSLSTERYFTTLKLLDCKLTDERLEQMVITFALKTGLRLRANLFECSDNFLHLLRDDLMIGPLTSIAERPYWIGLQEKSPLEGRLHEIETDYCDGERPYL